MSRILLVAVLAAVVLAPAAAFGDPGREVATRVVESLSRGDSATAANSLHYPPGYTPQERREDAAAVAKSFAFLLDRFGGLAGVVPTESSTEFFHIGGGGGDVPYWESVSPYSTRLVVFETTFSKFGPGYVAVSLIGAQGSEPMHVKSVEFGLPTSAPNSKPRVVNTMAALLEHMEVPTPPGFVEMAARELQPTVAPPASPR